MSSNISFSLRPAEQQVAQVTAEKEKPGSSLTTGLTQKINNTSHVRPKHNRMDNQQVPAEKTLLPTDSSYSKASFKQYAWIALKVALFVGGTMLLGSALSQNAPDFTKSLVKIAPDIGTMTPHNPVLTNGHVVDALAADLLKDYVQIGNFFKKPGGEETVFIQHQSQNKQVTFIQEVGEFRKYVACAVEKLLLNKDIESWSFTREGFYSNNLPYTDGSPGIYTDSPSAHTRDFIPAYMYPQNKDLNCNEFIKIPIPSEKIVC
jgi:hypothetical protein